MAIPETDVYTVILWTYFEDTTKPLEARVRFWRGNVAATDPLHAFSQACQFAAEETGLAPHDFRVVTVFDGEAPAAHLDWSDERAG